MERIRLLPDSEFDIMRCVWNADRAMLATEINEGIKERKWALSSLMSVLSTLVTKGYLICDRTMRRNSYSAAITQQQYAYDACAGMLRALELDISDIIVQLFDAKILNIDELERIRDRVEKITNKMKGSKADGADPIGDRQ